MATIMIWLWCHHLNLTAFTDRGVLLFVSRTTLKIEIYEVKGKQYVRPFQTEQKGVTGLCAGQNKVTGDQLLPTFFISSIDDLLKLYQKEIKGLKEVLSQLLANTSY